MQLAVELLLRPLGIALNRAFGLQTSPLQHLGALAIFFCWIVLVSGIWLLIFFKTSVSGAYDSVTFLMNEQWYIGGVMRSLHRYASDALIVCLFLHILREFSLDTYRAKRWFTWVSGIPLVWMVFLLGISGFWLVWDELAQYVAITSSELIDAIPIFANKMAANFLSDSMLSDRFFTLMAFLHLIGLPIFLVFGIWLHLFRLKKAEVNPPVQLMIGTVLTMLLLSIVFPAPLMQKADLATAPAVLKLDWFYLHVYPLVQAWSPNAVWLVLGGLTFLLAIAPWLPPARSTPPARVDLANCNGCERCADDCPYDAIQMRPRSDGSRYQWEAVVDPELCVSCGICVGSCPTATPFRKRSKLTPGIDLPSLNAAALKQSIDDVTINHPETLQFACYSHPKLVAMDRSDTPLVKVECCGQIPPSYFDYILSRNLCNEILLLGCGDRCRYRFGQRWTEDRISRTRDPHLRRRVDSSNITIAWSDTHHIPKDRNKISEEPHRQKS